MNLLLTAKKTCLIGRILSSSALALHNSSNKFSETASDLQQLGTEPGKHIYRMPHRPLSAAKRAAWLYRSKAAINHTQVLDLNRKTSCSAP